MLRIDRHRLGPRVYVLGTRVHEWHLGAALLLGLAVGALFDRVDDGFVTTVAAIAAGLWLVAKDWRDLFPAHRDSAAWRLGLHARVAPAQGRSPRRPAAEARGRHRGARGPREPRLGRHARTSPGGTTCSCTSSRSRRCKLSHAAAIPASMLLLVTAPYLWRRRQGALRLALVLLLGLTVLDLLKGLDVEAAAGSAGAAGVLWLGRTRSAFDTTPTRLRPALRRVPLLAACEPAALRARGLDRGTRERRPRRRSCARPATRSSGRSARSTSTTSSGTSTRRSASPACSRSPGAPICSSGRSPYRGCSRESSSAERLESSCGGTATTRSPTSSSAATSTTSSARTDGPSSATASRPACSSSPATRSARPGDPGAAARAEPVRRDARAEARGARRGREHAAALGAARAAVAVPGRRGGRRHRARSHSRAGRSARSGSRSPAWRSRATRPSCAGSASSPTRSSPSSRR